MKAETPDPPAPALVLLESRLQHLRQRRQAKPVRRPGKVIAKGRSRKLIQHAPKRPAHSGRLPVQAPRPSPASRVFNLSVDGRDVYEDSTSGLRRLKSDPASIIVAVDGACLRNGQNGARAGFGVFFSSYAQDLNRSGPVPPSSPQTSQFAELFAATQALEAVIQLIIAGEDLSHVVMKTDSSYLEKGLSYHIWKWARNGFRNWKGKPVVNGRAFIVRSDTYMRRFACLRGITVLKSAFAWFQEV